MPLALGDNDDDVLNDLLSRDSVGLDAGGRVTIDLDGYGFR